MISARGLYPLAGLCLCLCLGLTVLLSGCSRGLWLPEQQASTIPASGTAASPWEQHRARVEQVRTWNLHGRVGIDAAQESWTATLNWDQRADGYQMRFIAPLSQGTFELAGNRDQVSLRLPDNQQLIAADAQSLMQKNLGWSLPVNGMPYWVRGIPAPDNAATDLHFDGQGRITDFAQDGWRVSVMRYQNVNGTDLPDKVFMLSERVKVRLVVSAWQLTPN